MGYQLTNTDGFDLAEFSGQGYLLSRDGKVLALVVFYESEGVCSLVQDIEIKLNSHKDNQDETRNT